MVRVSERLYRGGGTTGRPAHVRKQDVALIDGIVKAQDDLSPLGISTNIEVDKLSVSCHVWLLRESTELPAGLAVANDSDENGGDSGPGHRTIYPTRDMPFTEFKEMIDSLPWEAAGSCHKV